MGSSKLEHLEDMKDYINNALANLAYGITHATQKVTSILNENYS